MPTHNTVIEMVGNVTVPSGDFAALVVMNRALVSYLDDLAREFNTPEGIAFVADMPDLRSAMIEAGLVTIALGELTSVYVPVILDLIAPEGEESDDDD
jgi:hypothetical protein